MTPKTFHRLLTSLSGLLIVGVLAVPLTFITTEAASLNTGFRNPSADAADAGGDGDGYGSRPQRAYSDDGSFAVDARSGSGGSTDCSSSQKDKHRFANYGFSLPLGATIQGIEVRLDALVDNTQGTSQLCVQLSSDGGATWTAAKTTSPLGKREATYVLGSPTDTWGRSWSDSNFNNSSFRVRVISVSNNTSRDFSLDWVAVRVHYSEPTSPLPSPLLAPN